MNKDVPPPLPTEYLEGEAKRRKRTLKDRSVIVLIVACSVTFLIWLFFPTSAVTSAKGILRTPLPKDTKVAENDDSGPGLPIPGGASDGYTWLVLQIPLSQITNFSKTLSASPSWKRLPLPPELAVGERYLQPTIMHGVKGHIPLETAKGFYILIDQQAEWNQGFPRPNPPYETSKPIWERPSCDYSFGVFDENTGRLYVWSINT